MKKNIFPSASVVAGPHFRNGKFEGKLPGTKDRGGEQALCLGSILINILICDFMIGLPMGGDRFNRGEEEQQ